MTTSGLRADARHVPLPTTIERLHVVVPARDEADRLPANLAALRAACDRVLLTRPELVVRVHVVLDSCDDSSTDVVAAHRWVDSVDVRLAAVGAARAEGVERARGESLGTHPAHVWIACTDADSVVPPEWLLTHLRLAGSGLQFLTGTVLPDQRELDRSRVAAWRSRHDLGDGHPHVFGANLGFTSSAYDRVGGFEPVSTGEDVGLVARMRAAGLRGRATGLLPVLTSARTSGRAPLGFADYLRRMAAMDGDLP